MKEQQPKKRCKVREKEKEKMVGAKCLLQISFENSFGLCID